MKLIISHQHIKRELETPFALCCSTEDLALLIRELQQQLGGMSGYGWIRVDPSHPSDSPPNTRALKWTEAGNINPPSDCV